MVAVIINPGTHADTSATLANAEAVAAQICKDIELKEEPLRAPDRDDLERGYFSFDFTCGTKKVEVDIPGDDADVVCEGRPWKSRRLYVSGSSWLYGFALGFIERGLGLKED